VEQRGIHSKNKEGCIEPAFDAGDLLWGNHPIPVIFFNYLIFKFPPGKKSACVVLWNAGRAKINETKRSNRNFLIILFN
jgi:hypothetical protein